MRVWHHGSALGPCRCPICRRFITLLIPTEPPHSQQHESEASHVSENIEKYNRSFGGGPRRLVQIADLPFFMRRLLRELMDPQRTLPLVFRARMVFAMILSMIYVLSPIDLLPEGVLGVIGFLDDVFILLIVFLHLAAIYRSILLYRHSGH